MGESYVLEDAVDARHSDVVRELTHKYGRHQGDSDGEVEDVLKVVLLDVDGAGGAHLETVAAVDTAVGHQDGLAVAYTQCLCGANLHAARAAYAGVIIYLKGVEERGLFHIVELLIV